MSSFRTTRVVLSSILFLISLYDLIEESKYKVTMVMRLFVCLLLRKKNEKVLKEKPLQTSHISIFVALIDLNNKTVPNLSCKTIKKERLGIRVIKASVAQLN